MSVLSDRLRRSVRAGLRWVRPLALAGVLLTTSGCMAGMGAVMMGGMMAGGMHGGGNELTAETAPLYAPDRVLGASDSLGLTAEQIELLQDVQDSLRAGQISPGTAARSTYDVLTPEQRRSVERAATPTPSAPAHQHGESGPLQRDAWASPPISRHEANGRR
ncbi:MAG: hypothetical protein ABIZ71_10275 [Gemmatimonadales bacterium]